VTDAGVALTLVRGTGRGTAQLVRFTWLELQSCVFAAAIFAGLLVAYVVPLPLATYDAMLIWCAVVTVALWVLGLESWREVLVICGFHALGLGLELFKVHVGSWAYPGEAVTKVAGVPLFAGFMYAAVGSYICQAWRRFDLRVTAYPALATSFVAVAIYANFFTHHWILDLRVALAVLGLVVLRRSMVHFTVGDARYRMPLALSFVLIGLFLWLAENAATYLEAWQYPGQEHAWQAVHTAKIGAWALLVTMSFVLVATVKAQEGRLYSVQLVRRRGQLDVDPGAAGVGLPDGDRATVRLDQPVDQVEPQTGATASTTGPELREHPPPHLG
jgi:uncharacterized membrane protein YoaT (DUF817 family)